MHQSRKIDTSSEGVAYSALWRDPISGFRLVRETVFFKNGPNDFTVKTNSLREKNNRTLEVVGAEKRPIDFLIFPFPRLFCAAWAAFFIKAYFPLQNQRNRLEFAKIAKRKSQKKIAEGVKLHRFFGMMKSVRRIGADEFRDGET